MSDLVAKVRNAIAAGDYVVGEHAEYRLAERGIPDWQVVSGVADGEAVEVRPRDRPNPVVAFDILLADGVEAKCVWAWLKTAKAAKLMTVHFYDRPKH